MKTLKLLLVIPLLLLTGCIGHRYQAVALSKSGIDYLMPQDRHGAELKALAINATGSGVAWVQRVPKPEKEKKSSAPAIVFPPGMLVVPDSDGETPKKKTTGVE
jgi:hypothetical protein